MQQRPETFHRTHRNRTKSIAIESTPLHHLKNPIQDWSITSDIDLFQLVKRQLRQTKLFKKLIVFFGCLNNFILNSNQLFIHVA